MMQHWHFLRTLNEEDPVDRAISTLAKLLALMRFAGFVLSVYAIIQGTLIIIGDESRFDADAYSAALAVPGAPDVWGFVLLSFGILSFVGIKNRFYLIGALGTLGAALWSFGFSLAFLISSLQYPSANLTAFPVYSKDMVLFLLISVGLRILHLTQKHEEGFDA